MVLKLSLFDLLNSLLCGPDEYVVYLDMFGS